MTNNRWAKVYAKTPRGRSSKTKDQMYVQFKQAWIFNHPNATPKEYEDAMKAICEKIGY